MDIGWFSTGRDEAACQLLKAVWESIEAGEIQAEISFVFSNREPGEAKESAPFFELVRGYDIPLICFSHRKFKARLLPLHYAQGRNDKTGERKDWRLQYDSEVNKQIEKFCPDLCVLAGYMLIVGEELCQKYNMINLHPAPPGGPTGSWQEVIRTLIRNRAKEAGAMMHLVTPKLDQGPVVSYCTFPLRGKAFDIYWQKDDEEMLFQLIRQHELAREFPLIILTLQALSRGEISIRHGRVINAQEKSIEGYNLSGKIDKAIENKIASLRSQ